MIAKSNYHPNSNVKNAPSSRVDPYFLVLGIPPEQRPINYYRLLGLSNFEADPMKIEQAFQNRMSTVLSHPLSNTVPASIDRLIAALQSARKNLGKPSRRVRYDEKMARKKARREKTASQDINATSMSESASASSSSYLSGSVSHSASIDALMNELPTCSKVSLSRTRRRVPFQKKRQSDVMIRLLSAAIVCLISLSVALGMLVAIMLQQTFVG